MACGLPACVLPVEAQKPFNEKLDTISYKIEKEPLVARNEHSILKIRENLF